MESITKIFGLIMLGVAIWLLDRVINPIFAMYLWALLFLGSAIYLRIYEHVLAKLITQGPKSNDFLFHFFRIWQNHQRPYL
jgi:thiol:disulfide interchange protein DsbD